MRYNRIEVKQLLEDLKKNTAPISLHVGWSYAQEQHGVSYHNMNPIIEFLDAEDVKYLIDKYCSPEAIEEEKQERVKEYQDIISNIEKEYEQ